MIEQAHCSGKLGAKEGVPSQYCTAGDGECGKGISTTTTREYRLCKVGLIHLKYAITVAAVSKACEKRSS